MITAMAALLLAGCGAKPAKSSVMSLKDSGWEKEEKDGETYYTTELSSDSLKTSVLYYATSDLDGHGYGAILLDPSGTKVSIPESKLPNKTFSVLGGYQQETDDVGKYGITIEPVEYEMESYAGGNLFTVTQIVRSESLPENTICIADIRCSNGEDQIYEFLIGENGAGGFVASFIDDTEEPDFETVLIKALVPDETEGEQDAQVSWGKKIEIESEIQGFFDYYMEILLEPAMSGFGVVNIGNKPIRMNAAFIKGSGVVKGVGLENSSVSLEYIKPYEFECDYIKQF